jgi:hypothetical protein
MASPGAEELRRDLCRYNPIPGQATDTRARVNRHRRVGRPGLDHDATPASVAGDCWASAAGSAEAAPRRAPAYPGRDRPAGSQVVSAYQVAATEQRADGVPKQSPAA